MTGVDTTSRRPFPLQVAHQADEPAHALLLRTVAHNGSSSFRRVLRNCGVPSNHSVAKADLMLVAHLCGADEEMLRHATAQRLDEGVELLGQWLRSEYFSEMWRRWCPACLAEEPYHRVWWDVTTVTACPFHGVELVNRCGCDKPLRHGEHAMTHCRLTHDLREVEACSVSAVDAEVDSYVVHRLLGTGQHPHPLLDSTSLGKALHVMERLGRSLLAETMTVDQARRAFGIGQLLRAGYRALAEFPVNLDQLLDELVSRRTEADRTSTIRTYGSLLRWLRNEPGIRSDCPLASAIRQEIDRHAEKNFIVPHRIVVDGAPAVGVPMGVIASQLGMNVELSMRLAKTLDYPVASDHPIGNMMPPAVVGPYLERVRSLETMDAVMQILGVRRQIAIELADLGHLAYVCRPFDRNKPAKGKRGDKRDRRLRDAQWNNWYFEPGTASAFLDGLRSLVRPDVSVAPEDLVNMYWPTKMFATRAEVLRLVLDGTLPLRAIDQQASGMSGLMVSRSEAQRIMKLERRDGYPLREAAPMMGMNYNQLRSCISNELVVPVGEGTNLSITQAMIDAFKATYIRTAELSSMLGVKGPRVVIRHLSENGVDPIETTGEIALTLYRREEAVRAALRSPRPKVFKNSTERLRHQNALGLPLAPSFKHHAIRPDWNKRSKDRSGRVRTTDCK
ncbi:TniQ family protein [Devosia chinhatensis]|uniref:TniQ domain-containing protein n=1 Tax=Devosia chinhatensis TaxID=429727 RepID=A0A0F5FKQ8_9HYPH|nr:TniQ family protein [Devosia chinhatensis]KKB08797.1 hypothetical protein VE26_01620 [Devosia chinhatensis]